MAAKELENEAREKKRETIINKTWLTVRGPPGRQPGIRWTPHLVSGGWDRGSGTPKKGRDGACRRLGQ